jgi:hypothetical protein
VGSICSHLYDLANDLSDTIEQRRISVLSQIRGCLTSLIKASRDQYADSFQEEEEEFWIHHRNVMSSALTVGFLTLESGRFLPDDQQAGNPDFHGVSFVDASRWVRSMIDLGDWMVRIVPPASRMAAILATLLSPVPLFGVALYTSGISACLSSTVSEELRGLIARLEAEDWGVDLV